MNINFTCNNCNEKFFISEKYISQKSQVICPNCDSEFPDEALSNLKNTIESLNKAHKSIPMVDIGLGRIHSWSFSLEE